MLIKKQTWFSDPKKSGIFTACFVVILALLLWWQKDFLWIHVLGQRVHIEPNTHYFSQAAKFTLTTRLNGEIRYTTDGSDPVSSSPVAAGPITLTDSAVLQYAVFEYSQQVTPTQTHDVFIGESHSLPIISLVTEPKNLWDEEIGIYVLGNHRNFWQEGKDWERPAEMRLYETDGTLQFTQPVGIRMQGNDMRGMPQKAFRLYIQDEDGHDSVLRYPLFGEGSNEAYASLILRNGGGDTRYALLRDWLASELVRVGSSEIDVQRVRPVVLYLNGQYWGVYFLQERFDETYFSQKYQVRPKALGMVEVPLSSGADKGQVIPENKGSEDDAKAYNELLADVRRCDGCGNYSVLNRSVDMNNFVDYMLFELYFANFDWPYNNMKAWRYQGDTDFDLQENNRVEERDGRFRWLLFDVDVGFGFSAATSEEMERAASGDPYDQLIDEAFPFRNVLYDASFRRQYVSRLRSLLAGPLSADEAVATVERLAAEIRPEIARHTARWGSEVSDRGLHTVSSPEEWESRVERLKEFVRIRPEKFLERTAVFFNTIDQSVL